MNRDEYFAALARNTKLKEQQDQELTHWGILGMHWGQRRFQNKDGTLTEAGKQRYRAKDIESDVDNSIHSNHEAYSRIKQNGPKIQEQADKLSAEYAKAFNNATLSEEAKARVIQNLKQDFGAGCDDEDLYEMVVSDYADDALMDSVNAKLKSQREEFNKLQDDYWEDVRVITKNLTEKYANTKVKDHPLYRDGSSLVNSLVADKLDTSWSSYVSRHFDDYWVNDTDAHYNAVERFKKQLPSMSEFNSHSNL